jgi:hypothetical protein
MASVRRRCRSALSCLGAHHRAARRLRRVRPVRSRYRPVARASAPGSAWRARADRARRAGASGSSAGRLQCLRRVGCGNPRRGAGDTVSPACCPLPGGVGTSFEMIFSPETPILHSPIGALDRSAQPPTVYDRPVAAPRAAQEGGGRFRDLTLMLRFPRERFEHQAIRKRRRGPRIRPASVPVLRMPNPAGAGWL